jgi:hypothetical protein
MNVTIASCLCSNKVKQGRGGGIFSRVQPFYEQAVSDLDSPMYRSLLI